MKDWKRTLLTADATLLQAMEVINESGLQIALVVDKKLQLLGTITDGDIRRALLKNASLDTSVDKVMCSTPTFGNIDEDREAVWQMMQSKSLHQLPLVDPEGHIVGIETSWDIAKKKTRANPVVIMAGGLGTRLRPLTDDCPKPLLNVGGRPILMTIIENFIDHGFCNFFLSIKYKGNLIEEYFGDGSKWGVDIQYLREDKPLGTAGSLSLMQNKPELPTIVMNGDILTKVNFNHLLDFHYEYDATATMCVREYDFQVPFGVAVAENQQLLSIEEKPVHSFLVNAGIYVLSAEVFTLLSPGEHCNMPSIFGTLIEHNRKTIVFPIHEYWLDLGRLEDITQAQEEYQKVFK